jgi:hypothetical protein
VAVTLPHEVVAHLRRLHSDLGWAIVTLAERTARRPGHAPGPSPAELVEIGSGQSLIVVPPELLRALPGVQLVPLSGTQALLALEAGRGLADLEVAVTDRLEGIRRAGPERRALTALRNRLRGWRRNAGLRFDTRSIILVTRVRRP